MGEANEGRQILSVLQQCPHPSFVLCSFSRRDPPVEVTTSRNPSFTPSWVIVQPLVVAVAYNGGPAAVRDSSFGQERGGGDNRREQFRGATLTGAV